MAQEFEKYKDLSVHIERMASTGSVGSPLEWDDFLAHLNITLRALQQNSLLQRAVTVDSRDATKESLQRGAEVHRSLKPFA